MASVQKVFLLKHTAQYFMDKQEIFGAYFRCTNKNGGQYNGSRF